MKRQKETSKCASIRMPLTALQGASFCDVFMVYSNDITLVEDKQAFCLFREKWWHAWCCLWDVSNIATVILSRSCSALRKALTTCLCISGTSTAVVIEPAKKVAILWGLIEQLYNYAFNFWLQLYSNNSMCNNRLLKQVL